MADLNLTLGRLRSSVRTVKREKDRTDEPFTLDQALNVLRNMADAFDALDEELSKKEGFLPEAWQFECA